MTENDLLDQQAAAIFNVPVSEVTEDQRLSAKDFIYFNFTGYAQRVFSRLAYMPDDELERLGEKLRANAKAFGLGGVPYPGRVY